MLLHTNSWRLKSLPTALARVDSVTLSFAPRMTDSGDTWFMHSWPAKISEGSKRRKRLTMKTDRWICLYFATSYFNPILLWLVSKKDGKYAMWNFPDSPQLQIHDFLPLNNRFYMLHWLVIWWMIRLFLHYVSLCSRYDHPQVRNTLWHHQLFLWSWWNWIIIYRENVFWFLLWCPQAALRSTKFPDGQKTAANCSC